MILRDPCMLPKSLRKLRAAKNVKLDEAIAN